MKPDTTALNSVAAHLGSLRDLLIKLAQGNEGDHGDDLMLAGTFYSIAHSVECNRVALDAEIGRIEQTTDGGAP